MKLPDCLSCYFLVGWLVGWLLGWLVGWLVGSFVGYPAYQATGPTEGRQSGQLWRRLEKTEGIHFRWGFMVSYGRWFRISHSQAPFLDVLKTRGKSWDKLYNLSGQLVIAGVLNH